MFLNKSKYFGKRKCVRNSGIYRVSRPYVGLNSHEITLIAISHIGVPGVPSADLGGLLNRCYLQADPIPFLMASMWKIRTLELFTCHALSDAHLKIRSIL